jgi:alcohol dehydrogenase
MIPMQEIYKKNLEIRMGVQRCEGISEILELIRSGVIDTRFILTHQSPLNDILKGYEIFGNKQDGCVKWVITPYER